MTGEDKFRGSKLYIVIAVFVIVVVFLAIVLGPGSSFFIAYVSDDVLFDTEWVENPLKRVTSEQLFGLEKYASYTYEINGVYPASLTVTTVKTLVMMSEDQIRDMVLESIRDAQNQSIIIDNETEITGWRVLENEHRTQYIIYDGVKTSITPFESVKIIGEVWNCGISGTSVICIGISQVTDNANDNPSINNTSWEKIVQDKEGTFGTGNYMGLDGLIYNVVCHN